MAVCLGTSGLTLYLKRVLLGLDVVPAGAVSWGQATSTFLCQILQDTNKPEIIYKTKLNKFTFNTLWHLSGLSLRGIINQARTLMAHLPAPKTAPIDNYKKNNCYLSISL